MVRCWRLLLGVGSINPPASRPREAGAIQRKWCTITEDACTITFPDVAAGTYAVACFHDENGNGKLDTGMFGIPTEGAVQAMSEATRARLRSGPWSRCSTPWRALAPGPTGPTFRRLNSIFTARS